MAIVTKDRLKYLYACWAIAGRNKHAPIEFCMSFIGSAPEIPELEFNISKSYRLMGLAINASKLPGVLCKCFCNGGHARIFKPARTAMQSGNKAGIDTQVRKLGQFADTVSVARSKVGTYLNLAANIESELSSAKLARETELSKEQAADLATAISELTLSQQGLQATLAVGARISQLNILDYLK